MITKEEFSKVVRHAQNLKALVIGDVMLDKYIYGSVERISPEAPVPVVNLHHTTLKAGGAANVAINLAAWGCKTGLIGLVGKDDHAQQLAGLLTKEGIDHFWVEIEDRPTTVKTRVVASSHHLLRIDEESSVYLQGPMEELAIEQVRSCLVSFKPDLIILEDYNKGFLTKHIIQVVLDYTTANNIYVAVDPKEQNFFEYPNVQLFKPNLREAAQASHSSQVSINLEEVSQQWKSQYNMGTIAITLGANGIFLKDGQPGIQVRPDRSIDVIDVCGAGDAVVCALALGLHSGLSLDKSGTLGNLAGAYVCSHSGVVAVNVDEIYQWI